MAEFAQDTIDVEYEGHTYTFGLLTPASQVKLGTIARFLRARDDPEGSGSAIGLDFMTAMLYDAMAFFKVLLRKADTDWPYSADKDGRIEIEPSKWTVDSEVVLGVYQEYLQAYDKFRHGGVSDTDGSGEEAVASEPDPGDQPVQ